MDPLGLSALAIQLLTGLWMGWIDLPGLQVLFSPANPIWMLMGVKLVASVPFLPDRPPPQGRCER